MAQICHHLQIAVIKYKYRHMHRLKKENIKLPKMSEIQQVMDSPLREEIPKPIRGLKNSKRLGQDG